MFENAQYSFELVNGNRGLDACIKSYDIPIETEGPHQ